MLISPAELIPPLNKELFGMADSLYSGEMGKLTNVTEYNDGVYILSYEFSDDRVIKLGLHQYENLGPVYAEREAAKE